MTDTPDPAPLESLSEKNLELLKSNCECAGSFVDGRIVLRLLAQLDAARFHRDQYKRSYETVESMLDSRDEEIVAVKAERDRLLRGEFTKEEIHGICHNLHGTVSADEFAEGCRKEMVKLYGECPWVKRMEKLEEAVSKLQRNPALLRIGGNQ